MTLENMSESPVRPAALHLSLSQHYTPHRLTSSAEGPAGHVGTPILGKGCPRRHHPPAAGCLLMTKSVAPLMEINRETSLCSQISARQGRQKTLRDPPAAVGSKLLGLCRILLL